MYALELVRRRKRRIWAAVIGGIGTIGVATFSIAAFLGHRVGSFTVALESKNAQLTLSEKSSFKEKSSFLRVGNVPGFQEYTYARFKTLGEGALDDEDNDYKFGVRTNKKGKEFTEFLKYTFYIKNVGEDPAEYDFSLQVKEVIATSEGQTLEDSFRVMVYDNGVPEVYAKRLQVPRIVDGEADYRAPVSVNEGDATIDYPFEGYAKMFASSNEVMTQKAQYLDVNEVRKYTVVTWLEGFQSSGDANTLSGASIKLGVEINAYEN